MQILVPLLWVIPFGIRGISIQMTKFIIDFCRNLGNTYSNSIRSLIFANLKPWLKSLFIVKGKKRKKLKNGTHLNWVSPSEIHVGSWDSHPNPLGMRWNLSSHLRWEWKYHFGHSSETFEGCCRSAAAAGFQSNSMARVCWLQILKLKSW